jgi:hypothetical protein
VTGLRPVGKQLLSNAPSEGAIPHAPTPSPLAFVRQAFGLLANRQNAKTERTHARGKLNSTQKLSQPSAPRSQGVALGFRVTGLRPVDKQLLSNAPSEGAIPHAPTPSPLAFVRQAFGLLANRQNAKTERTHARDNLNSTQNYPNLPPRRGDLRKPRATPWVNHPPPIISPEGAA